MSKIPRMMVSDPNIVGVSMRSPSSKRAMSRFATSDQPSTGVMTDCGAYESACGHGVSVMPHGDGDGYR